MHVSIQLSGSPEEGEERVAAHAVQVIGVSLVDHFTLSALRSLHPR